jgi:hypothetical protein
MIEQNKSASMTPKKPFHCRVKYAVRLVFFESITLIILYLYPKLGSLILISLDDDNAAVVSLLHTFVKA